MSTVRTHLNVNKSLQVFGITPTKYRKMTVKSLKDQHPGVTGVKVTESAEKADDGRGEPYVTLTAEGTVD